MVVVAAARGGEVTLEEFKARLPLAEVVGRYVRLTKAGREHRGLCPFHKEKTPSFNVVEEKGFFHCFGCGAHGNAIDFVMRAEGLDFPAAIERVADITGIEPPRRKAPDPRQVDANERLLAANAAAAAWFTRQLERGGEGRAYLDRRGVDRTRAAAFGLGYAPDEKGGLKAALLAQGLAEADMAAAGLLVVPEDDRPSFDRFRHRLMFPIHDERGRVVGFGGRALGDSRAKYLNTSETALFHKGDLLYNLHRAAPAARERRELVLAEGYMDVIALTGAGIPNAVAPLGTAVTERQLALLWRHSDAPLVCLDGDRAGLAAAQRAAERALPVMPAGKTLRFAVLPEGEDPDSFVGRHGAAALAEVLSRAHSLSQLLWRLETQGKRFDTPEAQAGLRRRLRGLARLAADPDLRTSLEGTFNQQLDAAFPRRPQWRRGGPPGSGGGAPRWQGGGPKGRAGAGWEGVGASRLTAGLAGVAWGAEARLLAMVIINPELLDGHEESFASLEFSDPELDRLRQETLLWFGDAAALDAVDLRQHLLRHGFADLCGRVLASVAQAPGRQDGTTAGLEAGEWEALLARWHRSSVSHQVRGSLLESLLLGGTGDGSVARVSLDRLLNGGSPDEQVLSEPSTSDPPQRQP